MSDHNRSILVYTGSCINANFIKSILSDNGISCMVRDSLMESTHSGFASGSPENSCRIFIEEENVKVAKTLIEEYLKTINF